MKRGKADLMICNTAIMGANGHSRASIHREMGSNKAVYHLSIELNWLIGMG